MKITRVKATNNFLIKTTKGVKLVTLTDIESKQYSVQHLVSAIDEKGSGIAIEISPSLDILIATTQNWWEKGK